MTLKRDLGFIRHYPPFQSTIIFIFIQPGTYTQNTTLPIKLILKNKDIECNR